MTSHTSRREFGVRLLGAAAGCALWPRAGAATVAKEVSPSVDLSYLAEEVILVRRSCWAAESADLLRMRPDGEYDRITFHHEGSGSDLASADDVAYALNGMLTGHKQRAYADIGYHFAIDMAGRVWEGRSLNFEGAHVSAQNPHNIGVVLLGDFDKQHLGEEQARTMSLLVDGLRRQYGIKRHRIYGHRDLARTVCPGRHVYAQVGKIRGE